MSYHEEPDPRTGKAPNHQAAALKAARNISNAEVTSEDEKYPEKHGFTSEQVKEIEEAVDAELLDDEPYEDMRGDIYQFDDGSEWIIHEDYEEAEKKCVEYVREDLESEPEIFDQDWLEEYITMTDTDRGVLANEEATNYAYNVLDDGDAMKEAGFDDTFDELENEIEGLNSEIEDLQQEKSDLEDSKEDEEDEDEIDKIEDKISDLDDEIATNESEIDSLVNRQEELPDDAREQIESDKHDEIYDELEDPVQYFVHDRGIYTVEELMEVSFITIDIDEAAQDAVDIDGVEHFLSSYDGDVTELDNGMVMYRTN